MDKQQPSPNHRRSADLAVAEEILTNGASVLGSVLAPVATDAFELNQAIEALRAYSLVRRDPKEKTLSIHRLVQAVLQDQLSEEERRSWAERAMLTVNATFPHAEAGTWPQCERLLTQALTATQIIEQYQMRSLEAGRLLHETAFYLQARARYMEAESLYERALSIWERHPGPEHLLVTHSLTSLASLYRQQGKYAEAEPLYQRALHIYEQTRGPEHPETTATMYALARLQEVRGNREEARIWYAHTLAVLSQTLGEHHPKTARTRKRFIALLHTMGQHEQAAQLEVAQSEPGMTDG